jgi:TonB-dependent SusC/RagA subfamily outer membrane receptor
MSARSLLALAALCAVASPAAPQTRTIAGVVVDRITGLSIPAGEVVLEGTRTRDKIRPDGVFVLHVPVDGEVKLTFRCPGYAAHTLTLAQGTEVVGIALEPRAVSLEGVSADAQRPGGSVAAMQAGELERVPAAGIPEALAGKQVGADIQRNSGVPGGAWQVRLRGVTSLTLPNTPLYIVDGILVSDASIPSGVASVTGGQVDATNRIIDLVAGDVESIEVLRGAAAASLYGSRGAGGVVVIRTKRGRSPFDR